MIDAYLAGIPGNGKPVPDGAKLAKIHRYPKQMETFPATLVPDTQHGMDFMVKDSKRFAGSGGWGWGTFVYDVASDTFGPGTTADSPPQDNDAESAGWRATRSCRQETISSRITGTGEAILSGKPTW